ncbi:MAG: hypothetical protein ACI857_002625 [Arenicella sp.]|jgi:hypothetical protein
MINLAPHSRVWVYQSNKFLSEEEQSTITSEMTEFVQAWASHGNELYGDFSIQNDLFLMVGADESKSPTSGCSLDSLTRKVQELGVKLNIDFFNRLNIAYEDPSTKINLVSLGEFKNLMSSDTITGQTTVYNNLIETVADLDENWRCKVKDSWHTNIIQIL